MIVTGRGDVQADARGIEIEAAPPAAPPATSAACPATPSADEAAILERLRLGAAGPVDVALLRSRRPVPSVMRRVHPATWTPMPRSATDEQAQPVDCPGCGMLLAAATRFCRRCGSSIVAAS